MAGTPLSFWIGFNVFVLAMLALDLCVLNRKSHVVGMKEALGWSALWIALAMIFNVGIWLWHGPTPAIEFLSGYLLEKALSVDNLFVFVLLFGAFRIPPEHQHRVLFWGILGALIMRALFIAAGVTLISRFHWMLYVFGAFLVFTGIKMWFAKGHNESEADLSQNPVLKLLRKIIPITHEHHGSRFLARAADTGKISATPMLVALVLIEATDVVFALDSIPAVIAVTRDPFIVYTSNIFAILGLRALYFALAGMIKQFYLLQPALAFVLVFIGAKMLAEPWFHVPVWASLAVIAVSLTVAVVGSLLSPRKSSS